MKVYSKELLLIEIALNVFNCFQDINRIAYFRAGQCPGIGSAPPKPGRPGHLQLSIFNRINVSLQNFFATGFYFITSSIRCVIDIKKIYRCGSCGGIQKICPGLGCLSI